MHLTTHLDEGLIFKYVAFAKISNIVFPFVAGSNNKYWTLDDHDTLESANTETITFLLEFCDHSRVQIKSASNGRYLLGEQNGLVTATADKKKATMWEF